MFFISNITKGVNLINKQNPDPLLNRKEAARYLGKAPATLAAWACTKRYDLPYLKIGAAIHYRKSDLDRFLEQSLIRPFSI